MWAESFDLLAVWGGRGLSVVCEGWFDVLGFYLLTPFTVAYDVKLFACVATQEFPRVCLW